MQHYEDRPGGSAFGQFENGAQQITRQVSSRIQTGTIIRKRLAKESWHGAADKVRVMFFVRFSFPFDNIIFVHFCTKLKSTRNICFLFFVTSVSMCVREQTSHSSSLCLILNMLLRISLHCFLAFRISFFFFATRKFRIICIILIYFFYN